MNSPFFDSKQLKLFVSSLKPYIESEDVQIVLATICAYIAHGGKKDKEGVPYFEHPNNVSKKMDNSEEKIVALLHDVLEDSNVTVDNLRSMGFSDRIIEAVVALTRHKTQTYEKYLIQVSKNPLATSVKRADIQDNLDPIRLKKLNVKLQKRLKKKYEKALFLLDKFSEFD